MRDLKVRVETEIVDRVKKVATKQVRSVNGQVILYILEGLGRDEDHQTQEAIHGEAPVGS